MVMLENKRHSAWLAEHDTRARELWYARWRSQQAEAIAWNWECLKLHFKQCRHDARIYD